MFQIYTKLQVNKKKSTELFLMTNLEQLHEKQSQNEYNVGNQKKSKKCQKELKINSRT